MMNIFEHLKSILNLQLNKKKVIRNYFNTNINININYTMILRKTLRFSTPVTVLFKFQLVMIIKFESMTMTISNKLFKI